VKPLSLFTSALAVAVAVTLFAACGSRNVAMPSTAPTVGPTGVPIPASAIRSTKAMGLQSNGGAMTSFGDVVGQDLADTDYDKFIDKAVTGSDRQRALKYLKLMPKNLRGDFVYVDVSNGKILSNRTDLVSKVKLRAAGKATAQERALAAVGQTRRPMSYPPTGGASTGLYIRWYSPQGMNALWGYATPPCDAQFNNPSADTGYMYFNAYSGNSQTGGSVVDAGVAQGLYPHNSQTLNAYINVTGNFLYSGWTNETQTYQCSSSLHLNMLYGTLDDGSDSVLMVGVPSVSIMGETGKPE
jgi:hypothetical protein